MTKEDIKTIIDIVHKTIYGFFDVCDEEETPMTDKDELLLKINKAICTNIKALEQEPCEDCVRRQEVLDVLKDEWNTCLSADDAMQESIDTIKALQPVTPQPKMGRWIEHFDESGKWYECDQCHTDWGGPVNYCPNCGAKMEGDKR